MPTVGNATQLANGSLLVPTTKLQFEHTGVIIENLTASVALLDGSGDGGDVDYASLEEVVTPALDVTVATTIKPDIIVGFVFLGLSALLLLSIIAVCIYVQRPFKKVIRYYRHLERKRMLAKMGVDEIHDLQYDAGFITKPKTAKPAFRRHRLISQHFDTIIDLDPNHIPPNDQFYRQHAAMLAAKRITSKHRMRGRWSQGERTPTLQTHSVGRASLDEPAADDTVELVPTRGGSLPVFNDDQALVPSDYPARDSIETTTLTTTSDPDSRRHEHVMPIRLGINPPGGKLPDPSRQLVDDEDEELMAVSMSSATLGVESVSKHTPQSLVLQEMIAKSRAASTSRANDPSNIGIGRRSSAQPSPLARQTTNEQQVVGRFRVSLGNALSVPVSRQSSGEHEKHEKQSMPRSSSGAKQPTISEVPAVAPSKSFDEKY